MSDHDEDDTSYPAQGSDSSSSRDTTLHQPTADWIPEEAVANITMERSVRPSESNAALANRIFEENLPAASVSICHLALHSPSEKIRLDAAKYVVERNIGKPDTASQLRASLESDITKWEQLLADAQFDPSTPNALPNN